MYVFIYVQGCTCTVGPVRPISTHSVWFEGRFSAVESGNQQFQLQFNLIYDENHAKS